MAQRTYLIGLYLVFKAAHKYATRYQDTIAENVSPDILACIVATIDAIAVCLPLIKPADPIE